MIIEMSLIARFRRHRPGDLLRFYQAAIINTVFGYGFYAILIWLSVSIYPAQLIAYTSGAIFNYLTYSRHAFPNSAPAKLRFVGAYAGNYFVNVGLLALLEHVLRSPYLIGVLVMLGASLVNYLALRYFVFVRRRFA